MAGFVRVATIEEFGEHPVKLIEANGEKVALFRLGADFYALSNTCLHRGGPLGQGFVEGSTVTCPWHNWTWDVTTGANVVNGDLKVACYATRVEDGQVLVEAE